MKTIILEIEGMSCPMCEAHINEALRNNLNVHKVKSSYKRGITTLKTDEDIPDEVFHQIIDPTGYILKDIKTEKRKSWFK